MISTKFKSVGGVYYMGRIAGYHGGRKKNFIVRENVVFIGLLKA